MEKNDRHQADGTLTTEISSADGHSRDSQVTHENTSGDCAAHVKKTFDISRSKKPSVVELSPSQSSASASRNIDNALVQESGGERVRQVTTDSVGCATLRAGREASVPARRTRSRLRNLKHFVRKWALQRFRCGEKRPVEVTRLSICGWAGSVVFQKKQQQKCPLRATSRPDLAGSPN